MFKFKKIKNDYIPLLIAWFKEPHVKKWWPVLEEGESFEHFLKRIRSKDIFAFLVELDNKPIGYIQYYYIDSTNEKTGSYLPGVASSGSEDWLPQDLSKTTVGTDQFIVDPNYLHKGYGTQFIKQFIKYLWTIERTITIIIVDPVFAPVRSYARQA